LVAVADRVAVAGWQWRAWIEQVVAVILIGDFVKIGDILLIEWLWQCGSPRNGLEMPLRSF
jgi:hypothetical protein